MNHYFSRTLAGALLLSVISAQASTRLFTAPRETPRRLVDGLPEDATEGRASFAGTARPGELFVFQIGLEPDAAAGPLDLTCSDLKSERDSIPAAALRCLSLGGIGDDGLPFTKRIIVPAGAIQILWCGIDVPRTAEGRYQGVVTLSADGAELGKVKVDLTVEGAALEDHGDSVAKNLSRLRWLDSKAGDERTLTQPFVAVKTSGRVIRVLGRELALSENGLPSQVTSFFNPSNTAITEQGKPVLTRPFSFVAETSDGVLQWESSFGKLEHDDLEARWSAQSRADGLVTEVAGRLDYTGSGELRVVLRAERDLELEDIRLEVPWREDAADLFMGLNRRGGRRPADPVQWRWDVAKRQDCFWMGDVNAGMMLRFKDELFVRPLVNIYYEFLPLNLPASWGNANRGGVDIGATEAGVVPVRAYSGKRTLKAGETLTFVTELYLTPFRPLDTEKQWSVRFHHPHAVRNEKFLRDLVGKMDPATGANVLNIHQAHHAATYINYPYADDNFPELAALVKQGHEKGAKVRVYYTTRELTQNLPELFALHSMNGEIIFPGPGREARTLIHRKGPHPWLIENLGRDFVPAWVDRIQRPEAEWDLSVVTRPDARWNNFYLEGLKWMVDKIDLDGIYVDDTALNARSVRRARRILDTKPGRLIDLHTWNHFNGHAGYANNLTIYMEILPYLDRLWLGEGFNCNAVSPDYWLVEMSGLPFGLMSEMLDGVNPWRGLVFGETARLGWSGDPRELWKAFDRFGIRGTEFIPFHVADVPVKTGRSDVLATVYRGPGRSLVALASWAPDACEIVPQIDWKALGLDPAKATLYAPGIPGFQSESLWKPGEAVPVSPGRGWLMVLDEEARDLKGAIVPSALVDVFRDGFTPPDLEKGWKVVRSAKASQKVGLSMNALFIESSANAHGGIERKLPPGVRAVEVTIEADAQGGQTWGPGVALVWPNGRAAKINLRLDDRNYGTFAGQGLHMIGTGVAPNKAEKLRILLAGDQIDFHRHDGKAWRHIGSQSRQGLEGNPSLLRLGKTAANGFWKDFSGPQGGPGKCTYRELRVLGN